MTAIFVLIDRHILFIIMKHIFAVFACLFWQGLDINLGIPKNKHRQINAVSENVYFCVFTYSIFTLESSMCLAFSHSSICL